MAACAKVEPSQSENRANVIPVATISSKLIISRMFGVSTRWLEGNQMRRVLS